MKSQTANTTVLLLFVLDVHSRTGLCSLQRGPEYHPGCLGRDELRKVVPDAISCLSGISFPRKPEAAVRQYLRIRQFPFLCCPLPTTIGSDRVHCFSCVADYQSSGAFLSLGRFSVMDCLRSAASPVHSGRGFGSRFGVR